MKIELLQTRTFGVRCSRNIMGVTTFTEEFEFIAISQPLSGTPLEIKSRTDLSFEAL